MRRKHERCWDNSISYKKWTRCKKRPKKRDLEARGVPNLVFYFILSHVENG